MKAKCSALLVSLFSIPMVGSAAVLMLDFGPTAPTGNSLTNSPYHSVNGSFTDTTWNVIGLSNWSSGLLYSDGTGASGVTLTLGSSVGSTIIDYSRLPSNSSALGAAINTGVFAGTSVGTDGVFTSAPNGNNLVGIKVGGLSAGRYDIYSIGANTSNGVGYQTPTVFYALATSNVSTFQTSGLDPSATTLLTPTNILSWTEGGSYGKMTVDLNAGEYLLLIADGTGAENRGFLNAVQIVAVPEPSVVVLCVLGLFAIPLFKKVAGLRKCEQE